MSKLVISPACLACYGLLASDLENQYTQLQPAHPWTAPITSIICNIYCQFSHYQKEDNLQVSSEDKRGEGDKSEGVLAKPLTNQQIKHRAYKAKFIHLLKGYEEASKIGITGIAEKAAKDPDGYCKLQSHVLEQETFIGKQFYSISRPLVNEFKKQQNALKAPGLETNLKEDSDRFT
ncbi:hypothetical protein VP01_1812g3 [Puccinia sorghi]|uniref:Tet-like 2OG-Fe(II) oxygenase domain-containing protein n=1 Tax=Puccinia sorghi TaxID=27349 RepID=A0A0L6VEQ1_9BASI|nr:hypothetical protein VP01_1812g3 [Puccinia sorghi]